MAGSVSLSVCVVTTTESESAAAAAVYKQSYFSQTFYAYPPRREEGEERRGKWGGGAQEMCQLYGSLGRVSQQSRGDIREGRGTTTRRRNERYFGGISKRQGRETWTESESKWIGKGAELLRPAECLECQLGSVEG